MKSAVASGVETDPSPAEGSREDWIAVAVGLALLGISVAAVILLGGGMTQPFDAWLGKPGAWTRWPWEAFLPREWSYRPGAAFRLGEPFLGEIALEGLRLGEMLVGEIALHSRGLVGPLVAGLLAFAVGRAALGVSPLRFAPAFLVVFLLTTGAYLMSSQVVVKHYNLSYALWALLLGLIISNTVGVPGWLKPAVCTELYIKTGLVLLGAEVLLDRLLALGVPGIFIAWVVTPIVLISTFVIGQRLLRIASPSLNMVISADMSVCGVSAAIATAAACRAKKEELSIAVSMSLVFTVVMMVVMPAIIAAVGMDHIVGGAWMGGTIDSTGAVAAAGAALSPIAEETAATVKMIQNVLIGVTAFGVAVYWTTRMEARADGQRPDKREIWRRFPKFVIGFLAASLLFTALSAGVAGGPEIVEAAVADGAKTLRGWFFCLAFVSIGLDTNFRLLWPHLGGGKPLVLYLIGQTLNLLLTLAMAYLMFGILFRDWVESMLLR